MENTRNTILLADDEEFMLEFSSEILMERFPNLNIEPFSDGASLEKRLGGDLSRVRLVITDNQMSPGPDGSSLIRKYARSPEFKGIRFVLCYGGQEDIGKKAMSDGAFGIIRKPYNIEPYCEAVQLALLD